VPTPSFNLGFARLRFDGDWSMYVLLAFWYFAGLVIPLRIVRSPVGAILSAPHDNPLRASALGHNIHGYKLTAFVVAAACAGLADGLLGVTTRLAPRRTLTWTEREHSSRGSHISAGSARGRDRVWFSNNAVDDRRDTVAKFHATATITGVRFLAGSRVVAYRPLLSADQWTSLPAAPTDERTLIRYASLSGEDLDLILSKRGHRNQLGFAGQICLMRFPGRSLALNEIPSALLHFLGDQLGGSRRGLCWNWVARLRAT
jgi:hypothetical protein